MSVQYNKYLSDHKRYVMAAFYFLKDNLPELFDEIDDVNGLEKQICQDHDMSKYNEDEYKAYDAWFYGNKNKRSFKVSEDFDRAWLIHIHRNPHHWQHWVLNHDSGKETVIEMPYNYIIEMICDWWSFSWSKSNVREIFEWYDTNKKKFKMHPNTVKTVNLILNKIELKLDSSEDKDHDEVS
ncbi:MAG: DUF5662 family protein [Ruminococcus sp.]|nr:DUF5662 family protein [Ruminococcus sp.]